MSKETPEVDDVWKTRKGKIYRIIRYSASKGYYLLSRLSYGIIFKTHNDIRDSMDYVGQAKYPDLFEVKDDTKK